MIDIKMTINGKPVTEAKIKDALEQAMVEAAVAAVKEKIAVAITVEEASEIIIDVVGDGIENLSLNVEGTGEIVNKINDALA